MSDTLKWSEDFSVGNDLIDSQHRDLFALVALIAEMAARPEPTPEDETVVARTLLALRNYVRVHFSDEERLMAEAGYPELLEHIEEHRTFAEWLGILENAHRTPDYSFSKTVRHMSRYLADWLVDHILGSDKRYAPYLEGKKPGA